MFMVSGDERQGIADERRAVAWRVTDSIERIRGMRTPSLPASMRHHRGFTLIEMMITVVIVAILSAVVYPMFMDSIRKGRRSDAFTALNAVQQAQERFRANRAAFASSITNAPNASPAGLGLSSSSPNGLYTLSVSDTSSTDYVLLATAVSGKSQASDSSCVRLAVRVSSGTITYGSAGSSGSIDYTDAARCWSR